MEKDLSKFPQDNTSFIFNIHENFFEREVLGTVKFHFIILSGI